MVNKNTMLMIFYDKTIFYFQSFVNLFAWHSYICKYVYITKIEGILSDKYCIYHNYVLWIPMQNHLGYSSCKVRSKETGNQTIYEFSKAYQN